MKSVLLALGLSLLLFLPLQAAEEERSHFLVGYAQDTLSNDWRSAQVHELQQAFAAYPEIRFVYTNAQGRTPQQIRDMEDLVAQGVDLLIASPQDGLAMTPAISMIHRQGIPVVLLTRQIPTEDYTSFISPDDEAIAVRAAELLAERLGGKGRIVVLQGVPTATTAILRTRGFVHALQRYPEMEIVALRTGNYLRADALLEMEKLLLQGLAFDAIYAQSDSMASGARMALRAAGIEPQTVPIVAIDYIPEAREAIRNGEQLASFTYPTCAEETAEQVVRILKGQPFERRLMVESVMVTRDNVEQVEPIF